LFATLDLALVRGLNNLRYERFNALRQAAQERKAARLTERPRSRAPQVGSGFGATV